MKERERRNRERQKWERERSIKQFLITLAIVAAIVLIPFILNGCKTCVPIIEYRDSIRTVEVRTHDTTIVTAADSASLQLLLRCDSANNVLIDEVNTANGDRLSLQLKLQRLLNGQSRLNIQCREDSLLQIIQWQDSIVNTMTHQTIVQQVEVVPEYYKNTSIGFWILLAVFVLLIGWKIYKIYRKIRWGI